MSPDWFTQVDFEESSYDEHFQRIQEPQEGYDYIQYLNDNLAPDSDSYNYARVDLSRAAMQYTEEFLIYFLSYINTEDDFVEDLLRNQVRDFCDHYTNGNPDEYFDDTAFEFDDRLKAAFGYDEMLEADDPTSYVEADLTTAEIEECVEESVENITAQLGAICRYYYDFIDIYNSIKHGNKFQLSPEPEIEISGEYTYQPDQAFATFLCKHSGDTSAGEPYLSNYPIDRCMNRSLTNANLTKTLFVYMDAIVEDRLDDESSRPREFLLNSETEDTEEIAESDDPSTGETIEVWNTDSKSVLPETEELAERVSDSTTEVAMRMMVDNDTLHVRTRDDTEKSEEYPIMGSISYYPEPGPRLNIQFIASFNFNLKEMDICQYHHLLKYNQQAENEAISQMVIEYEHTGTEVTESVGKMNISSDFSDEDYELYEDLALAQEIAQIRLPLPPGFLEEQTEKIREAIDGSPEQDDVIHAIEAAQEIGNGEEWTEIMAEEADENGNLRPVDKSPGFIELEYDSEHPDAPESLRAALEDPDFETENPLMEIPVENRTYEQFLEDVGRLGPLGFLIERPVEHEEADGVDPFTVEIDINYKAQTFWYDLHRIFIRRVD